MCNLERRVQELLEGIEDNVIITLQQAMKYINLWEVWGKLLWVLQGRPCEEQLRQPHAGHSWFQPAPRTPSQIMADVPWPGAGTEMLIGEGRAGGQKYAWQPGLREMG